MIIHIMGLYNSNNAYTCDEILPYVHHNYNKALHSLMGHSPFQVGLGFHPLCPIDVAIPFVATQEDSSHIQSKVDRANSFIEYI